MSPRNGCDVKASERTVESAATGSSGPLPLAVCAAIALAVCALRVPGFVALALGATAAWIAPNALRGGTRLGQLVLKVAVVALGARIDLTVVGSVGLHGIGLAALTVSVTCTLGFLLTRALGIEPEEGILITLGTAICGGSAIAAAAPVISARGRSIATALAIVFALNSIALVAFPCMQSFAQLPAEGFGEWCAIAIHDTSSVVGAAATGGDSALEIATITKLARSLWIVPCCIALSFWRGRRGDSTVRRRFPVPWFILGFLAVSALFQAIPAISSLRIPLETTSQYGMTLALFLLGGSLDRSAIRAVRVRHLTLGFTLWLILGASSFFVIRAA